MLEDDTFFITEVSLSDSGLARVAGALADHGGAGIPPGQRGWLRSWVTGWTHRLDVDPRGRPQSEPIAGVGRLAEAVVDVLLERRPLEQMRRWLSREVLGMLAAPGGVAGVGGAGGVGSVGGVGGAGAPVSSVSPTSPGSAGLPATPSAPAPAIPTPGPGTHRAPSGSAYPAHPSATHYAPSPDDRNDRRTPRFAARSMIRSVRLHQPASGIVESTVVVQDGPRVRAVALRFEQTAPLTPAPGRPAHRGGQPIPNGFNWMCTALQFT